MILKIEYDFENFVNNFENWVWFWKLGLILKIWYDLKIGWVWKFGMILKIGFDFENWVWFWKLGMILKIGYDFENWVWFWEFGVKRLKFRNG
jgi:hypothetical protein